MTDPIARIAAALERLSPPPAPMADPAAHPAYGWDGASLSAIAAFRPLPLARLVGVNRQRDLLLANLRRLADGAAAQDVLLWGARGTGKSALVKSVVAELQGTGADIAMIDVGAARIATLPRLFALIGAVPRAFVLFIDDLGFDAPGEGRAFRSLLEGGAAARPDNARLVVTSNRRHLVPRDFAAEADAINPRDTADDQLALADRFGLSLGFHAVDQDQYLAVVHAHAAALGLVADDADAIRWATQRGARSGRVAWHYVVDLAGRAGVPVA
ncbi:ATP-binding protein [Sphingomonas sp. BGYR3]|uniref:ATP-binding protein n=1 Tax=Sphingomonas sp. BGYR3 TaxID=2975483 RepID=UPI0021A4CDEE|nr:ATP-binding protein [Sphingomonas sp. BGYR3]MDG5488707.1 ATP-binding protein [Sphingomonas sp. BGYR3]